MKSKIFILTFIVLTSFVFVKSSLGLDNINASINPILNPGTFKAYSYDELSISGDFDVDISRKAYFTPKGANYGEEVVLEWYCETSGNDNLWCHSNHSDTIYEIYTGPCKVSVSVTRCYNDNYPNILTYAQCKMIW